MAQWRNSGRNLNHGPPRVSSRTLEARASVCSSRSTPPLFPPPFPEVTTHHKQLKKNKKTFEENNFPNLDLMAYEENKFHYLDIAIVGNVSAGKTTLLNTLFCETWEDMKIKRSTTAVKIYIEIPNIDTSLTEIRHINEEINNRCKATKGVEIIQHAVPRIPDIKNSEDALFRIWDFPGLQDTDYDNQTHDTQTDDKTYRFENILREKFDCFDLVIFLIDINLLDRKDEHQTIELILKLCKQCNKQLIILANKLDSLLWDGTSYKIDSEAMEEQFNRLKTILEEKRLTFDFNFIGPYPISLKNGYLYRLLKYNPNALHQFDKDHINAVGGNEYGARTWRRLSRNEQLEKIKHMKDKYDDGLKDSGLEGVLKLISETLSRKQGTFLFQKFINTINNIELEQPPNYKYERLWKNSPKNDPLIANFKEQYERLSNIFLSLKKYGTEKDFLTWQSLFSYFIKQKWDLYADNVTFDCIPSKYGLPEYYSINKYLRNIAMSKWYRYLESIDIHNFLNDVYLKHQNFESEREIILKTMKTSGELDYLDTIIKYDIDKYEALKEFISNHYGKLTFQFIKKIIEHYVLDVQADCCKTLGLLLEYIVSSKAAKNVDSNFICLVETKINIFLHKTNFKKINWTQYEKISIRLKETMYELLRESNYPGRIPSCLEPQSTSKDKLFCKELRENALPLLLNYLTLKAKI